MQSTDDYPRHLFGRPIIYIGKTSFRWKPEDLAAQHYGGTEWQRLLKEEQDTKCEFHVVEDVNIPWQAGITLGGPMMEAYGIRTHDLFFIDLWMRPVEPLSPR